jgi:SWI/SNF-related matrix-associated actin-dependent regulator 1 of chromatin subfamily A
MVMIRNKYDKYCAVCGCQVKSQQGYARLESGNRWFTYCTSHKPEEAKGPATPAPSPVKKPVISQPAVVKPTVQAVRRLEATGKVTITPWVHNDATLNLLRSMPGRFYKSDEKAWYVSTSLKDRQEVLRIASQLQLEVDESLLVDDSRSKEAVKSGLYPYQVKGVDWLSKQDRAILGDEMGLGKTCETIMALEPNEAVLVVCPANAKYNWKQEFEIWRPEYKVQVLGTRKGFRWPNPGEAVIINYDVLPKWLVPEAKDKFVTWNQEDSNCARRTVLICDEAHAVKSNKTAKHKKIKQLAYKCKKVWFLTGTPLLNKVNDLMGLLVALNRFGDTFGTFNDFVEAFSVPHGRFGHEWKYAKPSPKAHAILRSVMLRRLRADVLPDLPEIQYQTMIIDELSDKLKGNLDNSWDKYASYFSNSSPLPDFKQFSHIRQELAASRIPAMLEYVEDCEDQDVPLVVFSAHREPIDTLAKRKGWAVITGDTSPAKRQEIVNKFQAGELLGIGLTIQAGGVAINLTYGHHALFVDLDWTPGLNEQAERRLLRIGQKNNVLITKMVSNHPLDLHLHEILTSKTALARETVDVL